MKRRRLGTTEMLVSEMTLGTWALGGDRAGYGYGPTDEHVSASTIREALHQGITFFDTADVYGRGYSESLLGRILAQSGTLKADLCVATKVGARFDDGPERMDYTPAYIMKACENSLKRLGRESIDLYQLHNPPAEVVSDSEVQGALLRLREKGWVRYLGVSATTLDVAQVAIRSGVYHTVQVPFSILQQEMVVRLEELARKQGVVLLFREPLASGYLSGRIGLFHRFGPGDVRSSVPFAHRVALVQAVEQLRFLEQPGERTLAQASIRFVLDHPACQTVIFGAKTPDQLRENVAAVGHRPLSASEVRRIFERLYLLPTLKG